MGFVINQNYITMTDHLTRTRRRVSRHTGEGGGGAGGVDKILEILHLNQNL